MLNIIKRTKNTPKHQAQVLYPITIITLYYNIPATISKVLLGLLKHFSPFATAWAV